MNLNIKKVDLLEQLRQLERNHKLIFYINGNYRFDHSKIKEVIYEEIPIELRQEYHRIVGSTIEKLHKENLEAIVGDLAFHFYKCQDNDKALFYLEYAANKARDNYLIEEAIIFYKLALELIEDDRKALEIKKKLKEIIKNRQRLNKVK